MGDVIQIPPKEDTIQHRRIRCRLTFDPSTRTWEWTFKTQSIMRYHGTETSYIEALRSAKQHIDLLMGET